MRKDNKKENTYKKIEDKKRLKFIYTKNTLQNGFMVEFNKKKMITSLLREKGRKSKGRF